MSINTREDANKYYQMINDLVDEYTEKNKIRPSNLKRYLQPGSERFNRFLERNKLNDIKGASVILKDVIEDRENMEKDRFKNQTIDFVRINSEVIAVVIFEGKKIKAEALMRVSDFTDLSARAILGKEKIQ